MNINQAVESIFADMEHYLSHLDDARYAQPLEVLSQSSAGQHTRHVIEFFQCLIEQRLTGTVNYDKRVRNTLIEQHTGVALSAMQDIMDSIRSVDPQEGLKLEVAYDAACQECFCVETTFERELVYNIEHAIHHLAMIKIGLRIAAPELSLRAGFGVAPSTVRYQQQGSAR
ncbi:MAG: hypothetical protein GC205_00980 [Bacteroidetes bacterium]|nr:hypothetical protein [Bacteroidota bacterium]